MKYLKKFESNNGSLWIGTANVYWKILTKIPHLQFSLEKIGMDAANVEKWMGWFENVENEPYFILFREDMSWSWIPFEIYEKEYEYLNAKEPDISDELDGYYAEIEGEKYNL